MIEKIVVSPECTLEPISLNYSEAIFENFRGEVLNYLPLMEGPEKLEETEEFINHCTAQASLGNDFVWVILQDDHFTGCCGFHGIDTRKPHFGIWLKKTSWGKGLGSVVVPRILEWGAKFLDVDHIRYPVDKRNTGSIKIIEKLVAKPSANYVQGKAKNLTLLNITFTHSHSTWLELLNRLDYA